MYQFPEIDNEEIFQDFICDLFNSIHNTNSFFPFGKKGHKQKGVDIFSSEFSIVIQCKKKDLSRKEVVLRKELMDEIENEPLKGIKENLKINFSKFIIASTYKDHPDLQEYCSVIKKKHNFNFELEYWGWTTISKRLEKDMELIKQYYSNLDLTRLFEDKERIITRNLEIKRRIENDFPNSIHLRRIIIKDSNINTYPEPDIRNNGISSWFRVNAWGLYHNGLEIIVSPNYRIIKESNGFWDFLDLADPRKEMYKNQSQVLLIGKIPFSSIIDYDLTGDDIYNEPHFYCHFRNRGEPYEEFEYLERHDLGYQEEPAYMPLNIEKRRDLPLKEGNKK